MYVNIGLFDVNIGKGYCFDYAENSNVLTPQTSEDSDDHECKGDGGKCPECQGRCNATVSDLKDDNCEGATLCFTGSSDEAVPGCSEAPFRPPDVNYCYDPQKQLDNAIVQWETMTHGLTSFTIQHRKVSISSEITPLPFEWECNRLRYEISYDLTTNTKNLIRLLPIRGVNKTPEECQESDIWDLYHYTPMVAQFPSIEQWFAYIQSTIIELKTENKEGWHNLVINYDRTYGYPTMIHFTSGSTNSNESTSSPRVYSRYFHHEFRKFKPQF